MAAVYFLLSPFGPLARATEAIPRSFNIPANTAVKSLKVFAAQSGMEVVFGSSTAGRVRTNAVKGDYTPREAIKLMVANTSLSVVEDVKTGALIIHSTTSPKDSAPPSGISDKTHRVKKKRITSETMKAKNPIISLLSSLFAFVVTPAEVGAAEGGATGSIEGRVQNSVTGTYLNNARVTIPGTHFSTLTNEFGEYRITGVPPGETTITVFYSGLPLQTAAAKVTAGQRVVKDVEMNAAPPADPTIKLDPFTVSASRNMSETAIATNEQRFAPNMKTVLSAADFGDQSEGNIGEFLKFMPGMFVSYVDQDARSVSMRGMPAHTTIITSNGNAIASSGTGADRSFQFEQTAINDAARIEYNKTLLPDMPAEGIGGTINIVTKSAFQRTRPLFTYRTYVNFNSTRTEFRKTPGVERNSTFKMIPGLDFSYVKPVNENFGFTIGGAVSNKFNPQNLSTTTWTLNADPATKVENPFLGSFTLQDTPKFTTRYSGRVGLDWRFAPNDVLTLGYSQQYYEARWMGRRWQGGPGTSPSSFSPEFTQGRPNIGNIQFTGNASLKYGTTFTPEFKYAHNGPVWTSEVRGAYSRSSIHMRNMENGHFQNFTIQLRSFNDAGNAVQPTIRLDQNRNIIPKVSAVGHDGAALDAYNVNDFMIASASDLNREAFDVKKSLFAHTQREIMLGVPIVIKIGGDIRQAIRDVTGYDPAYTFLGADGKAGTKDDAVSALGMEIVDPYSEIAPPYGVPKITWPSQYKLYDVFLANPAWWTHDASAAHRGRVTQSKYLEETITSGFVRLDASFFQSRLKIVGGARYQGYRSLALAGEVDTLGQYVRDAEGGIVTDSTTGAPIRMTGTALEITQNTNIERGVTTKGTATGVYPSFNAVYRLTENLQLRAGYADSISYPNLSDLARVTTVSDFSANTPRVDANSPLTPWTAKNYDLDLEYYTPTGGSITLSLFRKEISNFVNTITHLAGTPEAEAALKRYGYGALFPLNFEMRERFNQGDAVKEGWEFALHQNLDRYVPSWARGLTVFYNMSYTRPTRGISAGNLGSLASMRLQNWGFTFRRDRFGANLRWNHKPEPRRITPSTSHPYSYTYLDVDLSYRITPRMEAFFNAANITEEPVGEYVYTDATPDYARRRSHNLYGVQMNIGLKGRF